MKTIVRNDDNVSLYIFGDEVVLTVGSSQIAVGEPVEFIIGDCNAENVAVHTNVSPPSDWIGGKYVYAYGEWSLNVAYCELSTVDPYTQASEGA